MGISKRNYSILEYLKSVREKIRPRMSFSATTRQEWKEWRDALRSKLIELLGGFPAEKGPLNAEVLESVEIESYVREKVVYESEPGMSIPAYMLIPQGAKGKNRALLCLHGHGRGKVDVAGIARNLVEKQSNIRALNYDYGVQFVKRGYPVLIPDARCFGELGDIPCAWGSWSSILGKVMVGMRVWDAMRSIDYLQTRPEVDKDRIGCVGLSWGGEWTCYTAALDERIKVAVISGYFSNFMDMYIDRYGGCPCELVPNILKYADMPDIVSLIAPRPLLIEFGTRDSLYTLEVVEEEYPKVKKVYELLEVPERVDIDIFEGGHIFSGRKSFAWFKKWL